jgi:hypothetical protein
MKTNPKNYLCINGNITENYKTIRKISIKNTEYNRR